MINEITKKLTNVWRDNENKINVLSNIVARFWSMVSVYIFVPFYLKFLGEELYGLITFFSTLQAILNILGMGFSKVLRREYASFDDSAPSRNYKYKLLRGMELLFYVMAACIVIICFFGSGFITDKWLNIAEVPRDIVVKTIRIMGVSIALQIVANLYNGGIMGLGRQLRANLYLLAWSTFRCFAVIIGLAAFGIDIITVYVIYALSDLCYLIAMRFDLPKLIFGGRRKIVWKLSDFGILKNIWKIALSLILVSLFATINGQVNKLIISNMLSLTELGAYNLAYSLSNIAYSLALALSISAFLDYSKLFGSGELAKLDSLYLSHIKRLNIFLLTLGAFTAVFSGEIILLWSGNANLTKIVSSTAPLTIMGTTFQATQVFPYEFLIARGNTKPINCFVIINTMLILTLSPSLISRFGLLGAGMSWLISMILLTGGYYFYINRKYVRKNPSLYLLESIILPLSFSFAVSIAARFLIHDIAGSVAITVLVAVLFGAITLVLNYLIFDRGFIAGAINKYRHRKRVYQCLY